MGYYSALKKRNCCLFAKMGSIKDRNGMDLKEEDIKKSWQEYTENCTKMISMDEPGGYYVSEIIQTQKDECYTMPLT